MIEAIIQQSKRILLPSGRDYAHCVAIFEEALQIKIPSFDSRELAVEKDGRSFIRVKSRDVPKLIEGGFADVGITYNDVYEEYSHDQRGVGYRKIGEPGLTFSLLFPQDTCSDLERRLYSSRMKPVVVTTAYPRFLKKYLQTDEGRRLNILVSAFVPSGSVEAMVALGVADAVADVVNTGATAEANNLYPMHLVDIFPVVMYRE